MLLIPVRLLLSSPSLQKLTCDEQIAHYPTLLSIPADLAEPILSETDKYKIALRECYASFGAKLVAFEVGRLSGKCSLLRQRCGRPCVPMTFWALHSPGC